MSISSFFLGHKSSVIPLHKEQQLISQKYRGEIKISTSFNSTTTQHKGYKIIYLYKNTTCILQVCLATDNSSEKQTGGGTDDRIASTIVRSRDVSEEKLLNFGDVHGLLDGGVPTADLKEAALQCVLARHHGEENSHLVVPEAKRPRRCSTSVRGTL